MTEIESYIMRSESADVNDFKIYFKYKYRGIFYQQMKTHAAKLLSKEKLKYESIAEILHLKNHDGAYHHVNYKKTLKEVEVIVAENFNEWILNRKYPMTATIHKYNSELKEKFTTISYVLVNK